MCASYGLGGGARTEEEADAFGIDPLDTREGRARINEWIGRYGGQAKITGAKAKNLNPIIRSEDDAPSVEFAWWSLPRPTDGRAFNSRVESLTRTWRDAFQQRALLPATWYDEGKKRWTLPDRSTFAIAAITAQIEIDGVIYLGYSLVTRPGLGEASTVVSARGESRMPLVLPHELHDRWLDPGQPGDAALVKRVTTGTEDISYAMTTEAATLF